ncbi:MAG: hypothetical protein ABR597_14790 [Bacteroidales bacterium]
MQRLITYQPIQFVTLVKLRLIFFFFCTLIFVSAIAQNEKPSKLKRADSFFGVHFDLHASEDITDAGKTLTAGMIDTFLTKVKPDYIQVDCKGHPGISSYPTKVGYCEASLNRFRKETGIKEVPKVPSDKYYPEFLEYTRSLFRQHMEKYINAIHQYNPEFQITSNWAYTSLMPEKVAANVDFLSGDVTPQNGVYRSAFEARCVAPQGLPWDLMAWGFSWDNGKMPMNIKSSVQLQQEAAQIMDDEIPSLKNLTVQINTVKKPGRILLQPKNQELEIDFHDGVAEVLVTELGIHSILEIIP